MPEEDVSESIQFMALARYIRFVVIAVKTTYRVYNVDITQ
jgi:hypothetical protein